MRNLSYFDRVPVAFRTGLTVFALFSLLFLAACKDDDDIAGPVKNEQNQYVNSWILENMEFWYFWNETLPSSVDKNLAPDAYFTALLNKDDRFSWLQPNYRELINSLQGITKESGFEYALYRENNSTLNVVAQITYVKQNSPADNAGLKRGDLITHINGVLINVNNYQQLIKELKQDQTLTYKPLDVEKSEFEDAKTVSLAAIEFAENPNHYHSIIETEGRRIGYYVYTFFAPGTSGAYDSEMDNVFQEFKDNAITDLVLDLRFNSGGSEVSARNLGSLIGAGISSSSVFFKRQYNKKVNEEILKTPSLGEAFLTSMYANKAANIGSLLTGKRVYILTSSRTASASELIINSLRPYMEVFLIGDVTYGKNVGSISIFEDDDPKNTWGLQPIVVKVANSLGSADYGSGFTPDISNKDNSLLIYPLGDTRENLLSLAIEHITGKPIGGGRIAARAQSESREMIGNSLDVKARSFRLMMDETSLPPIR